LPVAADPGVISFDKGCYLVKESCGSCVIPVMRRNGADGEVSVKYKTIDRTAVGGKDFVPQEGTLIFRNNEVCIQI
jgi:solute carrier family 8 (sodium/calcium exchanger)